MTAICRSRGCVFNAYRAFQVWFHFQIVTNLKFVKRLDKLAKEIPANGTNLYIWNVSLNMSEIISFNRGQEGVPGRRHQAVKAVGDRLFPDQLIFPIFSFSLISDLCFTDTKAQRASILILKSVTKRPFLKLDK